MKQTDINLKFMLFWCLIAPSALSHFSQNFTCPFFIYRISDGEQFTCTVLRYVALLPCCRRVGWHCVPAKSRLFTNFMVFIARLISKWSSLANTWQFTNRFKCSIHQSSRLQAEMGFVARSFVSPWEHSWFPHGWWCRCEEWGSRACCRLRDTLLRRVGA